MQTSFARWRFVGRPLDTGRFREGPGSLRRIEPVRPRARQPHGRLTVSPARDNGGVVARPETGSIPDAPGSYQFLDAEGRVIYVGKAKSLRSRLSNYFLQPELLAERTRQMVTTAESVEWIVAKNEVEAFFLEFNLIKRHKPRFNIRLKDDKSYPYLAVTLDEDWPRAMVLRGRSARACATSARTHAHAIRETLDLLLRTFPIRTCTKAKFDRHHRLGRPCLYAHIEKCAAPCVGDIDHDDYDKLVHDLLDFLDGEHDAIIKRLEQRMAEAADQLEFELAARCATSSRASARRSSASRWWPRAKKTSTSSVSTRTCSKRACRCSTCARGGRRAQGPRRRQGRRRRDARARRPHRRAALRRRARGRHPRRRSSSRSSPKTASSTRSCSR